MNIRNLSNVGGYYPWLDAVRFLAAFVVLMSHSRNDFFVSYGELPNEQQNLFSFLFYFLGRLGHEAVIAFFVISGFLVGGRGLERILNRDFDQKSYAIDRAVRIGIPLVVATVLCAFTYMIVGIEFSWLTALGNLLSLQGILCDSFLSPFWSLSYEVWFYIILFGISLVCDRKIAGLIISLICCLVFLYLSPRYLLIWFLGAFAYLCKPSQKNNLILSVSFLLILATTALSIMASDSHSIQLPWKPSRPVMEMLLTISMSLFIQQIILHHPIHKLTEKMNRLFTYLASFSYTLYLTHRITLLLVFEFLFEKGEAQFDWIGLTSYVVILLICLFVSWLIYLFSEKHTATVKRKIKSLIV